MKKNADRIFIALYVLASFTLIVGAAALILKFGPSEPHTRFTRVEVHSKWAERDIEALNKALSIMREKGCSDPTSWYYQSAIHWIPDTIIDNKLCEKYHTNADLMEAWDNCTHTPEGLEKIHFLAWHRMYIWHFEKIVRKLSGYANFALPYWDYTDTFCRTMPAMWRNPKSSLYESSRYDSINMGYPIRGEAVRGLSVKKLFEYTDFRLFSNSLNAAPHGLMHDYIGAGNDTTGQLKYWNPITNSYTPTGLMGWVPTAGFDPIFWIHHSEIDHIWQLWSNSLNGRPITLEMLKSAKWPYVFFDENGKKVEYTPEQVYEIIYKMDYDFDDCPVVAPETEPAVLQRALPMTPLQAHPKKSVSGRLTSVHLPTAHQNLIGRELQVEVSFKDLPKGVYELYFNPSGNLSPDSPNFIGYMTFFGQDHKKVGEVCNKGCCGKSIDGRRSTTFTYQITENFGKDSLDLVIHKFNGSTKDLKIENITIK